MGLLIVSEVSTLQVIYPLIAGLAGGAILHWGYQKLRGTSVLRVKQQEGERVLSDATRRAEQIIREGEVETKANFLKLQQEFDGKTQKIREDIRETEKRL